jgi:hypothetical protein
MRIALVALLALRTLAAPAAADPVSHTPDVRAMHVDDCARARKAGKTCVIDMGKGEVLDGGNQVPTGTGVMAIETTKHASLLPIRRDFIVEVLKTAEDL